MQNINDHFFSGGYKSVWRDLIPAGLTEAETDFIMDAGSLQKGQTVLDIMCGYGRHALELGRRGIKVTAVDNEPAYTEEIAKKAADENLPVNAITADIARLRWNAVADAVICMGNSFNFFPEETVANLLRNMAAWTRPGGLLLVNSWTIAEIAIRHFQPREWHRLEGSEYLIENTFQLQPTRIESEHHIIGGTGTIEIIKGVDYIFTINELAGLMQAAGFTLEQVYSTPRKKRFTIGDGRAYIVARRN